MNLIYKWLNTYPFVLLLAAVIYITTAYNSHGFFHADEHYQIIEFAGLKLGTNSPDELAWEYKAHIRPAIQPTICFFVLKTLKSFTIENPYYQAFILRFLTAILSLLTIHFFVKQTEKQFDNLNIRKVYWYLSYFLWFIPLISVRFSSETWSGILFLLAMAIHYHSMPNTIKPYLLGIVLGFSFLFRFQIAFAIVGFVLWLFFIDKQRISYLLKMAVALLIILTFGILIDSWFYQEMVFTPWKYFYTTILDHTAPEFENYKWYYYVNKLVSYPSYFIGLPLAFAFIILIIYKPRNLLLWCVIPFMLVHSIVPHKEERFLFPVVFLFPAMLIIAYEKLIMLITNKLTSKILNYSFIAVFASVNLIGLVAMSQKSAGYGRMEITKYIHDNYKNKLINLTCCSWGNPYNPWHGFAVKFYREEKMTENRIDNLCELNDSLFAPNAENLLVIRKFDLKNLECKSMIAKNNFVEVIQSVPKWIQWLNQIHKGLEDESILILYRREKDKHKQK